MKTRKGKIKKLPDLFFVVSIFRIFVMIKSGVCFFVFCVLRLVFASWPKTQLSGFRFSWETTPAFIVPDNNAMPISFP